MSLFHFSRIYSLQQVLILKKIGMSRTIIAYKILAYSKACSCCSA